RLRGKSAGLLAWLCGGVPEWLKGTDCKSVGSAYVGSNPTPSTILRCAACACQDRALQDGELLQSQSRLKGSAETAHGRGYSSMVEQQPSKLNMRVRFPLPAPALPPNVRKSAKRLSDADFCVAFCEPA